MTHRHRQPRRVVHMPALARLAATALTTTAPLILGLTACGQLHTRPPKHTQPAVSMPAPGTAFWRRAPRPATPTSAPAPPAATTPATTLALPTELYPAALEAAIGTLVALGFSPDRIDAAAGIITTKPEPTAGLLTPWELDQATLADEVSDTLNQHERRVTIRFEPAATPPGGPSDRDTLTCRVEVVLSRVQRPGWRVETESPRLSRRSSDQLLVQRDIAPRSVVPIRRDDPLAERITADIARRLNR